MLHKYTVVVTLCCSGNNDKGKSLYTLSTNKANHCRPNYIAHINMLALHPLNISHLRLAVRPVGMEGQL